MQEKICVQYHHEQLMGEDKERFLFYLKKSWQFEPVQSTITSFGLLETNLFFSLSLMDPWLEMLVSTHLDFLTLMM